MPGTDWLRLLRACSSVLQCHHRAGRRRYSRRTPSVLAPSVEILESRVLLSYVAHYDPSNGNFRVRAGGPSDAVIAITISAHPETGEVLINGTLPTYVLEPNTPVLARDVQKVDARAVDSTCFGCNGAPDFPSDATVIFDLSQVTQSDFPQLMNGSLLLGGYGDDTIIGSEYDDRINGGWGNDLIDGMGGNDTI